jgi:hypothetical protein
VDGLRSKYNDRLLKNLESKLNMRRRNLDD